MRATTLFPSKLAAIAVVPVLALTIALIGGAFTDKAMAQNPSGGNSAQSFAVGGFTTAFTQEHVAFAAHSNPKKPGTYAGHVVQQFVDGTFNSGPVTCLTVFGFGNTALISFYVNNGVDQGTYQTFQVTDGGEPSMQTSPDSYKDCQNAQSNGTCDCGNGGFTEPVVRGNIVVSP